MMGAWLAYSLAVATLVIGFVGGLRVGRLQEQDAARRAAGLRVTCPICGARPGQSCTPTRHRVPSQRRPS